MPMLERLRSVMECLSGLDLSDVQVQYNSPNPARFQALAYAQGNQIYIGPGQEHHLAHELWHVVQQKQGRVTPTGSVCGRTINDDPQLEQEAAQMGTTALHLLVSAVDTPLPPAPRRRLPVRPGASSLVIQFTLQDAIQYALEQKLATKAAVGKTEEENLAWLNGYLAKKTNPREHQTQLVLEHQKPAPLTIPPHLQSSVPQPTPRPVIVNNNYRTWKEVRAEALKPTPGMGLGGSVPDIDLQTTLVHTTVIDPVFTQLNPTSSTGNIDVKSTAFPNLLHNHQNLAAKSGLNTDKKQDTARNIMRTVKRTSIKGAGTTKSKSLEVVSNNAEENKKAWNVAVAFAAELGIAETRHGGAAALAQAMATLYVIKHGRDIKWNKVFYGRGTGGGGKLAQLRVASEQDREEALDEAYGNLAEHIKNIYEEMYREKYHNREHLANWLKEKFKSWTAGYKTGFDPQNEVAMLLKQIAAEDEKYAEKASDSEEEIKEIDERKAKSENSDSEDENKGDEASSDNSEEEPSTSKTSSRQKGRKTLITTKKSTLKKVHEEEPAPQKKRKRRTILKDNKGDGNTKDKKKRRKNPK